MHVSPRSDDGLIPSLRIRRPLRLAIVCIVLALAVETGILALLVVTRAASSAYRDRQISQLACALVRYTPPGTEPGDTIRTRYRCGPYTVPRPSSSVPRSATTLPSAPRSTTPRADMSGIPAAPNAGAAAPSFTQAHDQGSTRTPTPRATHAPSQGRAPVRTFTRTVAPPAPSTVTRTQPAPRPSTTAPRPRILPGGILPSTVCGLAGLPLC